MTLNTAGVMTSQGLGFALVGALAEVVGAGGAIAVAGLGGLVVVLLLRPRVTEQRWHDLTPPFHASTAR